MRNYGCSERLQPAISRGKRAGTLKLILRDNGKVTVNDAQRLYDDWPATENAAKEIAHYCGVEIIEE